MYFNLTVFQLVFRTPPKLKHGGPQNDGPWYMATLRIYLTGWWFQMVEKHARQIGSFPHFELPPPISEISGV